MNEHSAIVKGDSAIKTTKNKAQIRINTKIAEIITDNIVLKTTGDGLDLLWNLYCLGFDKMIIHKKNVTPGFFN